MQSDDPTVLITSVASLLSAIIGIVLGRKAKRKPKKTDESAAK